MPKTVLKKPRLMAPVTPKLPEISELREVPKLPRNEGAKYLPPSEFHNFRSRSAPDCIELEIKIVRNTSSSQTPTGAQILNTREGANRKRNKGAGGKGSNQTGFPSTKPILRQLVSCKEKGRGQPSCYKSEKSEWLCGLPALQDGRHLHSERPD